MGDKVPADCRLIEVYSSTFKVDQAILTGESHSIEKNIDAVKDTKAVKQDMLNIIFSGTAVTHGKAHAVVVQTGSDTAIGDIHQSITSQTTQKTPLKQKLDDFGDQLAKVAFSVLSFSFHKSLMIGHVGHYFYLYCRLGGQHPSL